MTDQEKQPEYPSRFRFSHKDVNNGIALYLTCQDKNHPENDYYWIAQTPQLKLRDIRVRYTGNPTMILSMNDLKELTESLIQTIRSYDSVWIDQVSMGRQLSIVGQLQEKIQQLETSLVRHQDLAMKLAELLLDPSQEEKEDADV
jgi:hypothetical protein